MMNFSQTLIFPIRKFGGNWLLMWRFQWRGIYNTIMPCYGKTAVGDFQVSLDKSRILGKICEQISSNVFWEFCRRFDKKYRKISGQNVLNFHQGLIFPERKFGDNWMLMRGFSITRQNRTLAWHNSLRTEIQTSRGFQVSTSDTVVIQSAKSNYDLRIVSSVRKF